MQTTITEVRSSFDASSADKKHLLWNDKPVIQSISNKHYDSGSWYLEENMIVFVTKGILKIRYGNNDYIVHENEMAFIKKDILVEYETGLADEFHQGQTDFILISVRYELVKEFVKLAALSTTLKGNILQVSISPTNKKLSKYLDTIETYFAEPQKVAGSLIKIKLLELLFYLAGENHAVLEQVLDLREHFRNNVSVAVEENLMNSISLNQLAVMVGRSLSSFRRDFLAIYNMPPSQWIRKKRLEKAQELLAGTSMSVTDICYTLGFENIAHFSRLFKSQFGYSPSEFRSNMLVA